MMSWGWEIHVFIRSGSPFSLFANEGEPCESITSMGEYHLHLDMATFPLSLSTAMVVLCPLQCWIGHETKTTLDIWGMERPLEWPLHGMGWHASLTNGINHVTVRCSKNGWLTREHIQISESSMYWVGSEQAVESVAWSFLWVTWNAMKAQLSSQQ